MEKENCEEIKSWIMHSSNHGLPKIADVSKKKFLRVFWFLIFSSILLYCMLLIVLDILKYSQHEVKTSVNLTNKISDEPPTVSVCNDPLFRNTTNFSIALYDCEIKQSRYLETEKCQNYSFYKTQSECFTFKINPYRSSKTILFTDDSIDVGIKLTFQSNETNTNGIFAIVHNSDRMPSKPNTNRHYIDLFKCQSRKAKTKISYSIKKRRKSIKLPKPYNNCVENWHSVPRSVLNESLKNDFDVYDEELCLLTCERNFTVSECERICPHECTRESYIISKSIICDFDDVDLNKSTVVIHFQNLRFTMIKEVPAMTWRELLGLVG